VKTVTKETRRTSPKGRRRFSAGAGKRGKRVELGRFVVADPLICHGKPTYKGTRIMVWQILESLADGESVDHLVHAWGGRVSKAAILETIRLATSTLLDAHGRLNPHLNGQLAA
jgi:uncharacterized protein (DUF433 family)